MMDDQILFNFRVVQAVLSLSLVLFSIYIMYRWAVTLSKVDHETKTLLLGDFLAPLVQNTEVLEAGTAAVIVYYIVYFFFDAAGWRTSLMEAKERVGPQRSARGKNNV